MFEYVRIKLNNKFKCKNQLQSEIVILASSRINHGGKINQLYYTEKPNMSKSIVLYKD
jgi:hypothetical protein